MSSFQVERSFGDLSNVTVYWEADPGAAGELVASSGSVTFGVGQSREGFFVRVAEDERPELDRSFGVRLVNVSDGRLGEPADATLTLLASDDPYGVFVFANASRSLRLPEADAVVGLSVRRQGGLMGKVRGGGDRRENRGGNRDQDQIRFNCTDRDIWLFLLLMTNVLILSRFG